MVESTSTGEKTSRRIGAMTLTLKSDREIELTRVFDAPRRFVFEAMSKPEHVRRWWGPRRSTGFSKTRLASGFRDQIGLAPKLYARVVRFRHLLRMLQDGQAPLADVALSATYYDQPHMSAEFRVLGGITPREFLAGRHPVGDGSSAADRRTP